MADRMSREDGQIMQAPARVLVVGGSPEGPDPALVAQLAATAGPVVAVDRGLDALLAAGVAPALFCGDADSVGPAGAALVRAAERAAGDPGSAGAAFEVERYRPEKDDTDLALALRAVGERWPRAELVCCGLGGGRPDHYLGVVGRLVGWPGAVELVEAGYRGRMLHSGGTWELVGCSGRRFSFVPLAPLASVSIQGMRWDLDHAPVELLSDLGISNVVLGDPARITCHVGALVAWVFD